MKYTRYPALFRSLVIITFCVLAGSCARSSKSTEVQPQSRSELLLGTVCQITIYDYPSEEAFAEVFDRIADIEKKMSLHTDASEIAQINKHAGKEAVVVSCDTFSVIAEGLKVSRLSGGAFDMTVGPLVEAWGIGSEHPRLPPPEEIDALLPLVGYQDVLIDEGRMAVKLAEEGMMLDLGGIAKGYAADEAAKILTSHGVHKAIVNLGGNILTLGSRPDANPWRIGIQNPEAARGEYVMVVQLTDSSLVTSGPYERNFVLDGKVYHHILDTKSGYPVDTDMTSVSIIGKPSIIADALSTAVFSLGLSDGMALIESIDGMEAIFITAEKEIFLSSGLQNGNIPYALSDEEFHLIAR